MLGNPDRHFPLFFQTIVNFIKDDPEAFRNVMQQQQFETYTNFLFSASKLHKLLRLDQAEGTIVLDIYCQKLAELSQNDQIVTMIPKIIQGMLSLHLSMSSDKEVADFWEPLFEILAVSLEQKMQRSNGSSADYSQRQPLIELRPTSNLLSMLAQKKKVVDEVIIGRLYALVTRGSAGEN